jgi:hypothetical protein
MFVLGSPERKLVRINDDLQHMPGKIAGDHQTRVHRQAPAVLEYRRQSHFPNRTARFCPVPLP